MKRRSFQSMYAIATATLMFVLTVGLAFGAFIGQVPPPMAIIIAPFCLVGGQICAMVADDT